MLSLLAFLLAVLTLCLIAMQVVYVFGYQAFMDRGISAAQREQDGGSGLNFESGSGDVGPEAVSYHPPAAIVLCLKGSEENLIECLTGLVCQDYTDCQLFIVVDSDKDPVNKTVASFFADRKSKPIVQMLRPPHKTCSLKCSAITQAIDSIPPRYEVIAFIDADAVPDQSWLSDLVQPLADPSVGATTGNRWYSPRSNEPGTWVRKIWNAAAVVQMQRYQVPWGGSLALRTETIERCGLVEHWQKSFCEDTSLIAHLEKQKLRLHRVPNLILENTESLSLTAADQWITRQLLTVRLHHPRWSWVAAHALASGLVAIVSPLLIVLMLVCGEHRSLWTLIQAYVVWQLVNSWLLWMIERSNRRALEGRESFNRFPNEGNANPLMQFPGTLLTQWLYPWTALKAYVLDEVWWRGVSYKVDADGNVELMEETDAAASLRHGSKESLGLLATEVQRETDRANGSDNAEGGSENDAEGPEASGTILPSHFSKRSRN